MIRQGPRTRETLPQADLSGLIGSSMSDSAIYHQLRRAFVSVNNSWASSVRFGRFSSTCRLEEPKASPTLGH